MAKATLSRSEIMNKCLEEMQKEFPNSTLGYYDQLGQKVAKNVISTDSISVDYAMNGGLARMSCLVGYPSSGKTTIALMAIAKKQKDNPDANILYCDAEYALDLNYARAIGVDVSKLILLQPNSSEEGYNIIERFITSGVGDVVVIDSVAAMIPSEITDGKYDDSVQIGRMAALTTKAVQRINRLSGIHDTHIIWINQYKKAVSVGMFDAASPNQMNTNYYIPGGQNFPFFMQQIAQISRSGQLKQGNNVVSNVIKVKMIKNKIGVPYREAETVITFGIGIDKCAELVTLGIAQGIIVQETKVLYGFSEEVGCDDKISGRVKLNAYLREHPDVAEKVGELLRERLFSLTDDGVNNRVKIDRGSDDLDDGEAKNPYSGDDINEGEKAMMDLIEKSEKANTGKTEE